MKSINNLTKSAPLYFNPFQILKDFLTGKIEQNASPPLQDKDNTRIHRLVSSVAIAHVLVSHKVKLDDQGFSKLLSSLILQRDPGKESCSELQELLSSFPPDYHQ